MEIPAHYEREFDRYLILKVHLSHDDLNALNGITPEGERGYLSYDKSAAIVTGIDRSWWNYVEEINFSYILTDEDLGSFVCGPRQMKLSASGLPIGTIGPHVFSGTRSYARFGDDIISDIPNEKDTNYYLKKAIIGYNVHAILSFAFNSCISLEDVVFSSESSYSLDSGPSIDCIGMYAFANCTSLKSIKLPNTLRSLGGGCFDNCMSLKTVILPKNREFKTIGMGCFSRTAIESIEIPDNVTSIQSYAFSDIPALKKIVIPYNVRKIDYDAFSGSNPVIVCEENSVAHRFALGHSLEFSFM